MGTMYVARSVKLGKWASDVGLSKHVYKLGYTDEPVKDVLARGWAGETDWALVKAIEIEAPDEDHVIARAARKAKPVDPKYYPRIRDTAGLFKIDPTHVENHFLVARALAGEAETPAIKLKPADFAQYLLDIARA